MGLTRSRIAVNLLVRAICLYAARSIRRVARFAGSPHDDLDGFIIRVMHRITSLMRRSSITPNACEPWRLSRSIDSGVAKSRSYILHLARTMLYSCRNPWKAPPIVEGIE